MVKLLVDNGANISYGDVGQYALTAIEQNDLDLLKKIVHYGGDVTLLTNSGTSPLHAAISEGNIEIVKYLLELGANVDLPDAHGWTARDLADQQGHEEIQGLVRERGKKAVHIPTVPMQQEEAVYSAKPMAKYSSEPTMPSVNPYDSSSRRTPTDSGSQRRKADNFQNSLFGVMSAAKSGMTASLFLILIFAMKLLQGQMH